jgi:hypothetical protein
MYAVHLDPFKTSAFIRVKIVMPGVFGLFMFLALVWAPAQTTAQGIFGDLLGAMIQEGQRQSARDAWARIPASRQSCVQRALQQQGHQLNQLVHRGAMPSKRD